MSDGLFEMEPTGVATGDSVIVQTLMGDREGVVVSIGKDRWGFPVITVFTVKDTITVNACRVHRAPPK